MPYEQTAGCSTHTNSLSVPVWFAFGSRLVLQHERPFQSKHEHYCTDYSRGNSRARRPCAHVQVQAGRIYWLSQNRKCFTVLDFILWQKLSSLGASEWCLLSVCLTSRAPHTVKGGQVTVCSSALHASRPPVVTTSRLGDAFG